MMRNAEPGAKEGTAIGRVHYSVEYVDGRGIRRRARWDTFMDAERFKSELRMGSEAIIRPAVRRVAR